MNDIEEVPIGLVFRLSRPIKRVLSGFPGRGRLALLSAHQFAPATGAPIRPGFGAPGSQSAGRGCEMPAGSPRAVARPGFPQIRTCELRTYPAPHLTTSLRCSEQAVDHAHAGERRTASPAERNPSTTRALAATPREPAFPDSPVPQEFLEAEVVPGDSVVPVMALQLLCELLVLLRDRLVQVFAAPVR